MRSFGWPFLIVLATLLAGCGTDLDDERQSIAPEAFGIDTRGALAQPDATAPPKDTSGRTARSPRPAPPSAQPRSDLPTPSGPQSSAAPGAGLPNIGGTAPSVDPKLPRLQPAGAPAVAPSTRVASQPFLMPKGSGGGSSSRPRRDVKPRKTLRKTTDDVYELNAENAEGTVEPEREIKGSDPITISGNAYVNMVGRIAIGQMEHALNLFNGVNGHYPKDYAEFKKEILDAHQIRLPTLPYYREYFYDVENHKLVVREFPDRIRKQYERRESSSKP